VAADEEFNEPACAPGTCSGELGSRWDAKTYGKFAGWTNVSLTGSVLDIKAAFNGSSWTGGELEGVNLGHFAAPYFVETRAVAPAVYGMWPAPGWTWSYPYGSTCGVEVDSGELLGRTAQQVPQTVQSCSGGLTKTAALATAISSWHTYAAAVYLDHVDFYVDGQHTNTTYNSQLPGSVNRTAAADLVTDLDIGACGSWADCPTTTATQHMQVDYLRAWKP
jgi:hypothetical protein